MEHSCSQNHWLTEYYFHLFCRPGDEGYSSRQNEGYQGNYPLKDDGPPRRNYDRVESGERNPPRITGFLPFLYFYYYVIVVENSDWSLNLGCFLNFAP